MIWADELVTFLGEVHLMTWSVDSDDVRQEVEREGPNKDVGIRFVHRPEYS